MRERAEREAVRLQAAELFADGFSPREVAARLRVTPKSAYPWRHRWQIRRPRDQPPRGDHEDPPHAHPVPTRPHRRAPRLDRPPRRPRLAAKPQPFNPCTPQEPASVDGCLESARRRRNRLNRHPGTPSPDHHPYLTPPRRPVTVSPRRPSTTARRPTKPVSISVDGLVVASERAHRVRSSSTKSPSLHVSVRTRCSSRPRGFESMTSYSEVPSRLVICCQLLPPLTESHDLRFAIGRHALALSCTNAAR